MGSDGEEEAPAPASVSSLRARFEQQSLAPPTAPKPSASRPVSPKPKPAHLTPAPTGNGTSPTPSSAKPTPPPVPTNTKPKPSPKPPTLAALAPEPAVPKAARPLSPLGASPRLAGEDGAGASGVRRSVSPVGSARRASEADEAVEEEEEADPFATTPNTRSTVTSAQPSPHQSPVLPASAPPPPAAKKVPPPPPPSRRSASVAGTPMGTTPSKSPKADGRPPLPDVSIDTPASPPPLRPGPGSVRALASRFASAANSPAPSGPSTPFDSPPMPSPSALGIDTGVAAPSLLKHRVVATPRAMSDESLAGLEEDGDPFEAAGGSEVEPSSPALSDSSDGSIATPTVASRPMIPPRPALNLAPATEPVVRTAPPIPNRAPSIPPTSPTRSNSSLSSAPPLPTRGNNGSLASLHSLTSSTSSVGSLSSLPPPPSRKVVPPPPSRSGSIPPRLAPTLSASSSSSNLAPAVPSRPTAVAHATAPPSTDHSAIDSAPYLPPPPPTRSIAAGERLAPQRPAIPDRLVGGDDSSEDEEDEAFARSTELLEATFANRRPPTLRGKRPVAHSFHSWAIRGKTVVTAQHHVHVWHPSQSGSSMSVLFPGNDHKVLSLEFRAADADSPADDGRFVWAGTKEGHLFEVDTVELVVVSTRMMAHAYPVVDIQRVGRSMVTIDDSGRVLVWGQHDDQVAPNLQNCAPRTNRVADKQNYMAIVGDELWTAAGPAASKGATVAQLKAPTIRVYAPTATSAVDFCVTPKPLSFPESARLGAVTASAIVPDQAHLVYLGHEDGYISVWDRAAHTCTKVQRVAAYTITTMVGVGGRLWAGERTGIIHVFDVSTDTWTVKKAWKAHKEAVTKIVVDAASVWTDETLQVASSGADGTVAFWDGFLRDDWLDHELNLRQPEYCTYRKIRSLSISWNIDASRPTDLVGPQDNYEFLQQALTSVDSPDIIAIGFQEVIDLENKKLTAKSLILGSKKKTDKLSDGVSSGYRQWHQHLVNAVRLHMPPDCPYSVVHVGDMVGLLSVVFVKTSEAASLRDLAMVKCATGMGGRYGNKGGILARLVIDDSSICFINCHLAAGQKHRRQRNADLVDILEAKASFSPDLSHSFGAYMPGGDGTRVFDHELTILSGDLNYRIDRRREDIIASIKNQAWDGLLQHDQLRKGQKEDQSFRLRTFKEQPIAFAPTYKYDPGTDVYDSSVKQRLPAWCDRVLWRSDRAEKVKPLHYRRYECNVSDHRPISAAFDLDVKRINPDKRTLVWKEVEAAWFGVESMLLEKAGEYYGAI